MRFTVVDWIILASYGGLLLLTGLRAARRSRSSAEEYILSGRRLTLPGFVATLVATWYGGILGVGEYSYRYGISNWVIFGAPYYVFAVFFALFLARRVRDSMAVTIPDQLGRHYGKSAALSGSVLVFFISSPAPYVLMQAVLLQTLTGWDLVPCLLLGSAASIVSLLAGGFHSVVRMDKVQFALMFIGFAMLLAFLVPRHGFGIFFASDFPGILLTFTGGNSWQFLVVWFFIALWTLVSPQFHQLTLSAASPGVARRGILLSVVFWFVFDGMTTLSGLYARALLPGLEQAATAYPMLAELVLPPVAKALFFLGMLATVMSTTDGLAFISAAAIGRDLLARLSGRDDDRSVKRGTRIGIALTFSTAIAAAMIFPSVVQLWYVIGTLFIPALLLPLLATYSSRARVSPPYTLAAMAFGLLPALAAFAWGMLHAVDGVPDYPLGIEPMYIGLSASTFPYLAGLLKKCA